MSSLFHATVAGLDAVDRALQREVLNEDSWEDRASDKEILDRQWEATKIESTPPEECQECGLFYEDYDRPMGYEFPEVCTGYGCHLAPGESCVKGVDPRG